jgi:integrase
LKFIYIVPTSTDDFVTFLLLKSTLGDKMKILSQKYNLSAVYTNHSLRATAITMLDNEGYEARHIMVISGHKSEKSIRSYSRTDDSNRRKIAKSLSDKTSVLVGTMYMYFY